MALEFIRVNKSYAQQRAFERNEKLLFASPPSPNTPSKKGVESSISQNTSCAPDVLGFMIHSSLLKFAHTPGEIFYSDFVRSRRGARETLSSSGKQEGDRVSRLLFRVEL